MCLAYADASEFSNKRSIDYRSIVHCICIAIYGHKVHVVCSDTHDEFVF